MNCQKCLKHISPNDYVIKIDDKRSSEMNESYNEYSNPIHQNQLFHINCFDCSECKQLISPGSPYGIINQNIYCMQHYLNRQQLILQQSAISQGN